MRVRIGTRGSALALAQSRAFTAEWQARVPDLEVEEVIVRTTGDVDTTSALHEHGGVGLFTSELEQSLVRGDVDVAVHSLKDLPTQLPDGLELGCVPRRASPWDVLVSEQYVGVVDLPRGAVIATGSLRRRAELLHRRPDLECVGIRGNIDTRLSTYSALGAGALVLAEAGLERSGRGEVIRSRFGLTEMTPAPAQGALGIEVRSNEPELHETLRAMGCTDTRAAVTAERAFLRALEGGCHAPIGAFARVTDGVLSVTGTLLSLSGADRVQIAVEGEPGDAVALGEDLARRVLRAGGKAIMEALRHAEASSSADAATETAGDDPGQNVEGAS